MKIKENKKTEIKTEENQTEGVKVVVGVLMVGVVAEKVSSDGACGSGVDKKIKQKMQQHLKS